MLNQTLLDLGFSRSTLDKCLYFRNVGGEDALVYVDDILLVGNDQVTRTSVIDGIINKMCNIFDIKQQETWRH